MVRWYLLCTAIELQSASAHEFGMLYTNDRLMKTIGEVCEGKAGRTLKRDDCRDMMMSMMV